MTTSDTNPQGEQAVSNDQVKRVERFNCTDGGARYCYGCYQMTPDNEYGDYVSYDDYAALLQQLAERDTEAASNRKTLEKNCREQEAKSFEYRQRAEAAERALEEALRDVAQLRSLTDACQSNSKPGETP